MVRIVGLLVALAGWAVAVSATQLSGGGTQLIAALLGFAIAIVGAAGIVNASHLRRAIWKR